MPPEQRHTHTHLYRVLLCISEKAMAPHSCTLAWRIPWMEETGGLQSMGSLRVGHDRATSLSLFTFMHWRRKWQPTPVFLLGESQGRGSLVGCCLWGHRAGHDRSDLAAAAAAAAAAALYIISKGTVIPNQSIPPHRGRKGLGGLLSPLTVVTIQPEITWVC